jgi:hypothetical protein
MTNFSGCGYKRIKIWMAHRMMANKLGRVEYSCPMIELMKLVADEKRDAFFSVESRYYPMDRTATCRNR